MNVFLLFVPIVIVCVLFAMRHEGLRSALRQSGAASRVLPPPIDELDTDDLDFFE
jgi:hypothetical protein